MKYKTTLIKNGRVIDPANDLDAVLDVAISRRKILAVGDKIPADFKAELEIDATGLWVLPGLVDLSVYLREPGQENKTRIADETYAAVSSGVTRVCCMPEIDSPIDSGATVKLIRNKAKEAGFARVSVIGALSEKLQGKQLSHMGSLKYVACVGVSQGREPIQDLATLRKAMEYAATYDLPLFLHPLEHSLTTPGGMNEGALATRLGLPPIPVAAETSAMSQILTLVAETQVPVHFCRLSSADSIQLLKQAKDNGLPVTADVAAHQLFLTEMDVSDYNPLCHVCPPLRSQRDQDALRQSLTEGVIDAVCSDHQPHEIDAKLAPFEETSPGISGLETLLPLMMRLAEEGVISESQAISLITQKPAKIAGLDDGSLTAGSSADLSLYDPQDFWQLEADQLSSKGKNTPFGGWGFNGRTLQTIVKGKTVFTK